MTAVIIGLCFYYATLCVVYAVVVWPSDRLHVCLLISSSHVGVQLKRLNVGLKSRKQYRTLGKGLYFADAKNLGEIGPASPPMGAPIVGGIG